MAIKEIPIIDLEPYFKGTEAEKKDVAKQVDFACKNIGFLIIQGHQIEKKFIEDVYDISADFFDLPVEEKLKVKRVADDEIRGYSAIEDESLAYSLDEEMPGDLKESLTIGPINVPKNDPYFTGPEAGPHFHPNRWPDNPKGLKKLWESYFKEMTDLSASLMRIFALSLDLPEKFFDDKIDRHISMFRVLNYPSQKLKPKEGQLRAGAHSDYGSLTICRIEDKPGGLQAQNSDGDWIDIPVVDNAFSVNIGDLMMQWTNDKWISTMHRVINPPRDTAENSRRQSLIFFHQPNYDAMVECFPSCQSKENPAKYNPISSGDHLRNKFMKQTTFDQ